MTSPALALDDVAVAFGGEAVLEDVSLDVPAGSTTALVGPNGSGKTTLLRVAAGELAPDAGTVERADEDAVRPVGYLPQRPGFREEFTVAETLAFYGSLVGGCDVDEALDRVSLFDARRKRVGALSGGMLRLLGVAVAVVADPPLVLLDEPSGDLDPAMTARIFAAVDGLAADGAAVVYATHDMDAAADADQVAVIADSAVVADGTPDDVVDAATADGFRAAMLELVGAEEVPGR